MVLQAFIDDSYKPGGLFVLGGHIATRDEWVAFSQEWEMLLPHFPGTIGPSGNRRFKMVGMLASVAEGGFEAAIKKVQPFFRVIEKHITCSLACAVDLQGFENAKRRVRMINRGTGEDIDLDWHHWGNSYFFTFRCLMDIFHGNRETFNRSVSTGERIDFIFDDQKEKGVILETWENYLTTRPEEFRSLYGAIPKFENDENFTPLQAADLWAWSVRWWLESGQKEKMIGADYGPWRATSDTHTQLLISFDEEQIVQALVKKILAFMRDRNIVEAVPLVTPS